MRIPVLLIGLILLAALAAIRLADPTPVSALRLAYFDQLQRIVPRSAPDTAVRVVDIDEASLARHGQWPWSRDLLAEMTLALQAAGARVIAFDMLFAEPDRLSPSRLLDRPELAERLPEDLRVEIAAEDTDVRFAETLRASPTVLGIARSDRSEDAFAQPVAKVTTLTGVPDQGLPALGPATSLVPALLAAASGLGAITVGPDGSAATSRELPLLWQTPDGPLPGLALETVRVALGEETLVLWGEEQAPDIPSSISVGDFDIPISSDGQLWLYPRYENPMDYIPAHQILSGDAPDLRGAYVLIGTSAAGLLDLRTTALGQTVPGVAIHAQAVEQILSGRFLVRSDLAAGLEMLMFICAGLLVTVAMARAGPVPSVLVGGGAGFAVAAASWAAFQTSGLLIDATFPLIAGFLLFSLLTLYRLFVTDRDARLVRQSFSHYVAPDVLREIETGGHQIALGGSDQIVTVMFTDVRNFTGMSREMDAQATVALLNTVFTELSDEIIAERGTIDKFMGDSVMAFWNAPVPVPDHAARACRAALAMRAALARVNAGREGAPVGMGIGIDTGPACVGNVGSRNQFNYTAIGEVVNRSARIEAACRGLEFDILAGPQLRAEAPGFAWLDGGHAPLRGIAEPVPLALLVGDETLAATPSFQSLVQANAQLMTCLAEARPIETALENCKLAARDIPGLDTYFSRIAERAQDFTYPRRPSGEDQAK